MSNLVQVVCPECDVVNRVPQDRLGVGAKCGKCRMMAPAFKAAVRVLELQAHLVKVNTEGAQVTVSRCCKRRAPSAGPSGPAGIWEAGEEW